VLADSIYFLLSCVAGAWQAWCLDYGADDTLTVILGVSMGFPFALASYAHTSILSKSAAIAERPDWKRMVILWIGMPLSLVMGALTILAETLIMRAVGYDRDELPFYSLRFLIGEAVACFIWAKFLLMWLRHERSLASRYCFLVVFATLFAGVLCTHGFSSLAPRYSSKYVLLTSIVETALSAGIVIFHKKSQSVGV
jgi:hypothetical protein